MYVQTLTPGIPVEHVEYQHLNFIATIHVITLFIDILEGECTQLKAI